MVIYLNRLFLIKTTKAAGQGRLSKFEAVEYSMIRHSWPYQLTVPALYQVTLHGGGEHGCACQANRLYAKQM